MFVYNFFHSPITTPPFRSKCSPQHPILNTLNLFPVYCTTLMCIFLDLDVTGSFITLQHTPSNIPFFAHNEHNSNKPKGRKKLELNIQPACFGKKHSTCQTRTE